jgi:hypothetical protein
MYDKYVIEDDSLQLTEDGFSIQLRIPYYRGLGLSMVNIVELVVDGEPVDLSTATFSIHGKEYPLASLPEIVDDRWGFTETATLQVHGHALSSGDHECAVLINLRVSYMPVPNITRAQKLLHVA